MMKVEYPMSIQNNKNDEAMYQATGATLKRLNLEHSEKKCTAVMNCERWK